MLVLPHSRFIHIPKTGGTWVKQAIRNSLRGPEGRPGYVAECLDACCGHLPAREAPGQGLFTFACVRHPMAWYISYWRYRQAHGWCMEYDFDRLCRESDCARFLDLAVEHFPAHYTRVLQWHLGEDFDDAHFTIDHAYLVDGLVDALEMAGETFDENALRLTPPLNVSYPIPVDATAITARVHDIAASEALVMRRFGYEPYAF